MRSLKKGTMRLYRFIFLGILITVSCTSHYYREDSNQIILYLKAPNAQNVQIAASYNSYALQPAERLDSNLWIVKLPKGITFSYFYLVDNQIVVPPCEMMEEDDFGQNNCIFSPKS
jgi:uncharacterized protein (UPF0333 family)